MTPSHNTTTPEADALLQQLKDSAGHPQADPWDAIMLAVEKCREFERRLQQSPGEPCAWMNGLGDVVSKSIRERCGTHPGGYTIPLVRGDLAAPAALRLTRDEREALRLADLIVESPENPPVLAGGAEGTHFMTGKEARDIAVTLVACVRRLSSPPSTPPGEGKIKAMVDRFLGWKLPEDFNPDGGIAISRPGFPPVGTNLFTADQAEAMFRYVLGGRES